MFDGNDAMIAPTPTPSGAAAALSVTRAGVTGASLVRRADDLHAAMGRAARELLSTLVEIDRTRAWEGDGARDVAHWVQMRYGVSSWKASRWMAAATALEELPRVAEALVSGELGLDKVVELTRFASAGSERGLVAWATTVSAGSIRRRADAESRRSAASVADVDDERRLRWWLTDEGRRMELMAELPASEGALVAAAIERVADTLPDVPGDHRDHTVEARRADALVALCSGSHPQGSSLREARPRARRTRPRIVVHVPAAGFLRDAADAVAES